MRATLDATLRFFLFLAGGAPSNGVTVQMYPRVSYPGWVTGYMVAGLSRIRVVYVWVTPGRGPARGSVSVEWWIWPRIYLLFVFHNVIGNYNKYYSFYMFFYKWSEGGGAEFFNISPHFSYEAWWVEIPLMLHPCQLGQGRSFLPWPEIKTPKETF